MIYTLPSELCTVGQQDNYLLQTLESVNSLCDRISRLAWASQTFSRHALYRNLYHQVRHQSQLSAQIVIHCFGKVANAYAADLTRCHVFKAHSPITYDERVLSWRLDQQEV